MEKAIFAAGCFWGVQAKFERLEGIIATQVGYTGGHTLNPTYAEVCRGNSGHAEALEIHFDPLCISYQALLDYFWQVHDPTTFHQQGADIGSQYRSEIFYVNDTQKEQAIASKDHLEHNGRYQNPIVTQITKASHFYRAEESHQHYLKKHHFRL